ncbi:hypothetical protein GCM10010112_24320 [Actinoplanes lobatus]|uniref:eCIS core domain-containing protein n=1 Tax=Actinoplanes lobatus TaxID=113568 RepID=A0A7W7MIH1_9ACTN|nr:DUF4157 domain-containing protein [Actinoplanes lobatus]MBB4751474.1 hypothetical protein [Actinoplanes lobatus]GGN64276.1 hypothetical protein GCM10010112_24320 [Actinoplanes lobatus]GIE41083.1 hypothetical protein Alo02nite_39810 [Actinoplanes lobatus]
MSATRATPDRRSKQDDRRRRRGRNTSTPSPRNIVSGAGQPLDLSVRRAAEERLGYDFGQVRLHTDRDADALTGLLGADAVAVGRDVFFRAGAYQPGTTGGQRLLVHELLHTVQEPYGAGALRAGRAAGAVSLPAEPAEQAAERAARESVEPSGAAAVELSGAAAVDAEAPLPAWMRYATVTADQMRVERLDPATLPDRLAATIVRSLRGDPADWSHRTRTQLARLPEELVEPVLDRLENRLLGPEYERVLDLIDEVDGEIPEPEAHAAPLPEPDSAEDLRYARELDRRRADEQREASGRPEPAPGPEKEQYGTPGGPALTPGPFPAARPNPAARPDSGGRHDPAARADTGNRSDSGARQEPASGFPSSSGLSGSAAKGESASAAQSGSAASREKAAAEKSGGETAQREVPVASAEGSAARNRPEAAQARAAGRQVRPEERFEPGRTAGTPATVGKDTQMSSAVGTLDPLRNQDLPELRETEPESPPPTNWSEVEVGGGPSSAWDVSLRPDDFLPAQDPDVSAIPTVDMMDPASSVEPSMPSFPAAPITRADRVQAEREAEDAEEEQAEAELAEPEPLLADDQSGPDVVGPALSLSDLVAGIPSATGVALRDPASGADPRSGPVDAQTTVQEVAGRSEGGTRETEPAAKEAKGTSAAGDNVAAAPEKASQQAVGGQATAPATESSSRSAGGPAAEPGTTSEPSTAPAAGTGSPSSARPAVPEMSSREPAPTPPAPDAPALATDPASREAAPGAAPPSVRAENAGGGSAGGGSAGASGGGGGGGSAAAPVKRKDESAPAPDLSTASPEGGLATAATLKPHRALEAMGGVGRAADRNVGDEHKNLATAPPAMQRPAGAPQTLSGPPKADTAVRYSTDPAQRSTAPESGKAEVTGAQEPAGPIEAEQAEEPGGWDTFKMALGFGIGKVASWLGFEVDAQELAAKFAGLPTRDEALKQAMAGNAPGVQMSGAAGQTSADQGAAVDDKGRQTVSAAREDAGRGMGEDQVYPDVPPETMEAAVPGRPGGAPVPAVGAPTGAVPAEAASKVAEHDNGPRIQTAFQQGGQGMAQGRQDRDRGFRDSQARHRAEVTAEVATNTENQAGVRGGALDDVNSQRAAWRTDQDRELSKLGTKKADRQAKVRKDVQDREKKADDDVTTEKDNSDKRIRAEATRAEQDAERQRDSAVQNSGNWVAKAFEWLKQKVIEIKNAIVRVIRAARDAVVGFIKNFKSTVERWINEARTFIVDAITKLITELIEFAKAMVQAVIELANRIRRLITDLIKAAIALVNRLAAMLKQIIKDLLDALGKLLAEILRILLKALMDVIKAVVDAVKQVLAAASQLLGALGKFMFIAIDFLSDPGGWLGGARNSAVDGAKNHLFREVKSAVKAWFQQKVEEILGVGRAVIDVLVKGGFTLEKIVKETWDAILPMLPVIIGEIVITKVIAKLIPGAGWVMAVIDAIRTAIGSLGAILRAAGAVLSWLLAVRQGSAGILFAKAVAAGIVALLELAYEALVSGIGKYVAKVGKRLKAVAQRLARGKKRDTPGAPGDGGRPGRAPDRPTTGTRGADTPRAAPRGGLPGRPAATPRPRPAAGPRPDRRPPAGPGPRSTGAPDRPGSRSAGAPDRPGTRSTGAPDRPGARPAGAPDRPGTSPSGTSDRPGTSPAGAADRPSAALPAGSTPAPARSPGRVPPATAKNRDGTPRTAADQRPDTRPTPPPRPRPEAKAPAKPSPGPKDADPAKPKNTDPDRPRDTDPSRSKPDGTGAPKPGRDGDRPGGPRDRRDADRPDRDPSSRPSPERSHSPDRKDRERKKDEESKDERLRRIVARIQPKVRRLVDRGVLGRPLRAALSGLRLWYRLTGLDTAGQPDFGITAVLNPRRDVQRGWVLTGSDLRRLVTEVSEEMLQRPDVQDAARRMRITMAVAGVNAEEQALEIAESRDIPGAVRYLQNRGTGLELARPGGPSRVAGPHRPREGRGRQPGAMETYRVGPDRDPVSEENRVGATNALTQGVGTYPEIFRVIQRMRHGDRAIAHALRQYSRTRRFPGGFDADQREFLRALHWLIFVRESVRDRANLGFAPMMVRLIERGQLSWEEAFVQFEARESGRRGGRGSFPMSMRLAASASRGIAARIRSRRRRPSNALLNRRELARRQFELSERWMRAVTNGQGIYGPTASQAIQNGREQVQRFMLRYYGLD